MISCAWHSRLLYAVCRLHSLEEEIVAQKTRILVAVAILAVLVVGVLGVEALRRKNAVMPGAIPISVGGKLAGRFTPEDLGQLTKVSFVEPEEGKTQEGWLLRDVLLLYVDPGALQPETLITVSSSSRGKSVQVTWAEVDDASNWVMLDLSNRGTLKLVSVLERLDTRDEWVQDVDKIEIGR